MRTRAQKKEREPTIALINVVFLMLIFFLIAGTVAPPLSKDVTLVETSDLDGSAPPEGLVILKDGSLMSAGEVISTAEAYLATLPEDEISDVRVIPDREAPAEVLLSTAAALKAAGAERVLVATERSVK